MAPHAALRLKPETTLTMKGKGLKPEAAATMKERLSGSVASGFSRKAAAVDQSSTPSCRSHPTMLLIERNTKNP
jgi:hypothetical protein